VNKNRKKIIIGCTCAILCEVLFGLSYLFTKQITESVSALTLLGWRFILAFLIMSIFVLVKMIPVNLQGKRLLPLFAIAILQPVIYFTAETFGISMTTASESGAFMACIPIAALIASALVLKKKPTKWQTTGVSITLVGIIICVLAKGLDASFNPIGYLMLLIAVISYSLYVVTVERTGEFTSAEKTYMMLAFGAAVFAGVALIENLLAGTMAEFISLPFKDANFFFSVLYLSVGCSVLGFFLANVAISHIGTNRTASFVGISTVVSILAGIIFLKESFTTLQIIGTVFVIGGVYVANMIGPREAAE